MAWTLASLTFLAHALSVAQGDGTCRGTAECESEDASSALLQLQQAVPVSRGPPMPKFDCERLNGTCVAQQTACELMVMMKEWEDTSNKGILEIKAQLKGLCYNGATGKVGTEATDTTAEVGMEEMNCHHGRYHACAIDVAEYYKDHPGTEFSMKVPKFSAQAVVAAMSQILRAEETIALAGSVAFSVVGAVIANFFPGGSGPPANPCTYAGTSWAQCVWKQILPLVANFVGEEITQVYENLWTYTLEGFQAQLHDINVTVFDDCGGNATNMSDATREQMFNDLQDLQRAMDRASPSFGDGTTTSDKSAAMYLSMFSSLHISVMTSVFVWKRKRTAGHRHTYQRHILCYAKKVLANALKARNRRISLVTKKVHGSDSSRCISCVSEEGWRYNCCGEYVTYQDMAEGCSWNEICKQAHCYEGDSCKLGPECKGGIAENAYNCHKAFVQKESDEMWLEWLAPIPTWLETVMTMQKAKLGRQRGRRKRRGGRWRMASEFEDDGWTCPP